MAECSQEFEDLLIKHEEECFDDWVLNIRSPECASAKGAILQYVAELEILSCTAQRRSRSTFMAECSQEFKGMLDLFGETSWENGAGESRTPPVRWATHAAILQYVAGMEAERDELRARLAEIERLRDALRFVVHEWESVPGGGMVHVNTIQRWLTNGMKPAIDKARDVLNAPQGGSNIEAANMTGGMP